MLKEWQSPLHGKSVSRLVKKNYSLPQDTLEKLKVLVVDIPVAAFSRTVIPLEGDGGPRNPCDKRVETALKRVFESTSNAPRTSAATLVFARAIILWAEELPKQDFKLSKHTKDTLKKMALSAAYAADASLESMQFCSRAIVSNVVARRNVWLRHWEVDTGSQASLAASPFSGSKLFGQVLDPLLIESKDKRKVLPTVSKTENKSKTFQPFHSFRLQGRNKEHNKFRPK